MSTPLDSTARAAIAAALKFEAAGDLVKAREAYILAADAYQRVGSQAGSGAIGSEQQKYFKLEQIRCLESALAIERAMPKAPPATKSALILKTAGVAAAKFQAGGAAGAMSPKAVGGGPAARKQLPAKAAGAGAQVDNPFLKDVSGVSWDDVAGLHQAKKALQEAAVIPIRFPELFVGARKPWRGILLYGPPGTGKSYLAQAVASECNSSSFLSVSAADIMGKYVGESEQKVRQLFTAARACKPSVVFIDEIDSLCSARSSDDSESSKRVKTEFLVQMQGVDDTMDGVLVIAATNIPWDLDSAIRRRFEKRIYIPLPDAQARFDLISKALAETPNNLTAADIQTLALETEGFSGADLSIFVRDAVMQPVRECQAASHFSRDKDGMFTPCAPSAPSAKKMTMIQVPASALKCPPIHFGHCRQVLPNCRPSVSASDLGRYDTWTREFGMDGANVAAVGGNDAESNQSQPALQGPSASKGAQKPPKSGDDSCRIC